MPNEANLLLNSGAKIKVIGVGGAGMNAVHRMMESGVKGVEFVVMNTDQQVLDMSPVNKKIVIGEKLTRGLGAGGDPEVGKRAAEDSRDEIMKEVQGSDMVFITAGMGGGTGTGAAPIVAEISRQLEILTIGVVTKPFIWEGGQRLSKAEDGVKNLKGAVDTLIAIPNSKLSEVCDKKITLKNAFIIADEILMQGVQGISDIIVLPGLINVDFADVHSIMKNSGSALMGIGEASGENRAKIAAEAACRSKLLDASIDGATGVLVNITANDEFSLQEIDDAMTTIHQLTEHSGNNVEIIFGVVFDNSLGDNVKITVVATGFDQIPTPFKPSVPNRTRSNNNYNSTNNSSNTPSQPASTTPATQSTSETPKVPTFSKPTGDFEIPTFITKKKENK